MDYQAFGSTPATSFKKYLVRISPHPNLILSCSWSDSKLAFEANWIKISEPQKQPAERAHIKKCRKSSQSVKTNLDRFRQFLPDKSIKQFVTFRQFSRGTNFLAPLGGL